MAASKTLKCVLAIQSHLAELPTVEDQAAALELATTRPPNFAAVAEKVQKDLVRLGDPVEQTRALAFVAEEMKSGKLEKATLTKRGPRPTGNAAEEAAPTAN